MGNGFQKSAHGCAFENSLRSADGAELLRSANVDVITLTAKAGEGPRRFSTCVYTGGIMTPDLNVASGYKGPVVVEVNGIKFDAVTPVHRDHDPKRPVAHTTNVTCDGKQLSASGAFSIDNADSREIIQGTDNGFPWRPSVGLKLLQWRMVREGETCHANGRTFVGPLLLVTDSSLTEIGLVTTPGDGEVDPIILATNGARSSATSEGTHEMGFEEYVKSLGLDVATLSPEAVAALQAQFDAMNAGEGDAAATAEAAAAAAAQANSAAATQAAAQSAAARAATGTETLTAAQNFRATIAAEEQRAHSIRTLCARFSNPDVSISGQQVNLAAHAIGQGWDADRTELEARRHNELQAMRDSRHSGVAIHSTSRNERGNLAALQAGVFLRAGIALDSPAFNNPRVRDRLPEWLRAGINDPVRQRAMNNAHEFRDNRLEEYAANALGLQATVPSNRIERLQAAFSSGAVSSLFGPTIGAAVLMSYVEIDDFTEGWTQEDENPDMEAHARIRLENIGDLEHNPIGGEAAHAKRSTLNESTQVDRFAKQLVMDEADFMSDAFHKLADTPRDFGLAAGRLRPNLGAMILLSNPTLIRTGRQVFNTTDNSSATGVALSAPSLSTGIAAIATRLDNGVSINLKVSHLIVPPQLYNDAMQITLSPSISNDSGKGEINVIQRYAITPVSEARLANGMTHPITKAALAGSLTNWFLASKEAHTILFTYLQGAGKVPLVRTDTLTGGKFGTVTDVRHYIGARAMDFSGFFRGGA